MGRIEAAIHSRRIGRFAFVAVLAGLTAACNSSYGGAPLYTGAVNPAGAPISATQPMPPALIGGGVGTTDNAAYATTAVPTTAVSTSTLPPVTSTELPPPVTTAALEPASAPSPFINGKPPITDETPAAANPTPPTGTATATGPQTITVEPGQTLYGVARQYGVPVSALAAANGIGTDAQLIIGQRLIIPAGGSTVASTPTVLGAPPQNLGTIPAAAGTPGATPTATTPATTPTTTANAARPATHTVALGETVYSIATRYGITPTQLAQANNLPPDALVRVGQVLTLPGGTGTASTGSPAASQQVGPVVTPSTTTPVANATPPATPTTPPTSTTAAIRQAATTPPAATPAPAPQVAAINTQVPVVADTPSVNGTTFRWPVRGRIISDFGPKANGERNDGINLAVPEGTSIKASEAGEVIYSGNEIAGYGNLILIRHADNWVSAYAHVADMLVSRGDQVQRGQTIAHAGMTGAVTQSQLHFELRQGSNPVNPLNYLTD